MELIKEIREKDVIKEGSDELKQKYVLIKASRGVILKEDKIGLLFVSKKGYYKLPGGKLEEGETKKEAFKREVLEETGCEIEIKKELGLIIEYRNKVEKLQINYCYVSEVIKETGVFNLSEKEKKKGFQFKWASQKEAKELIKNSEPKDYEGKFIINRDLTILNKVF